MTKELVKRHIVWVRIGPVLRCEWVTQRIVSLVPRVRLNHLRPADPAVTVLQKEPVYTHTFLEWEAWHAAWGHKGKRQVHQQAEATKGKCGQQPSRGFCRKNKSLEVARFRVGQVE